MDELLINLTISDLLPEPHSVKWRPGDSAGEDERSQSAVNSAAYAVNSTAAHR